MNQKNVELYLEIDDIKNVILDDLYKNKSLNKKVDYKNDQIIYTIPKEKLAELKQMIDDKKDYLLDMDLSNTLYYVELDVLNSKIVMELYNYEKDKKQLQTFDLDLSLKVEILNDLSNNMPVLKYHFLKKQIEKYLRALLIDENIVANIALLNENYNLTLKVSEK